MAKKTSKTPTVPSEERVVADVCLGYIAEAHQQLALLDALYPDQAHLVAFVRARLLNIVDLLCDKDRRDAAILAHTAAFGPLVADA